MISVVKWMVLFEDGFELNCCGVGSSDEDGCDRMMGCTVFSSMLALY